MRIGRAVTKTEAEGALALMQRLKETTHPEAPPAMATDAKGCYREAMVETWGKVPPYSGKGRPPTRKQPGEDWKYLQVQKIHSGSRLTEVCVEVIYGDEDEVRALLGEHTAYIERTHLTSRQMNGRLVRKTLSFSKDLRYLKAATAWEDSVYNWTRTCKSLCQKNPLERPRSKARTPAMAAGLADHVWDADELLRFLVPPVRTNTQ